MTRRLTTWTLHSRRITRLVPRVTCFTRGPNHRLLQPWLQRSSQGTAFLKATLSLHGPDSCSRTQPLAVVIPSCDEAQLVIGIVLVVVIIITIMVVIIGIIIVAFIALPQFPSHLSLIRGALLHGIKPWLINLLWPILWTEESLSNDTDHIDITASLWNGHRLGLRSNCRPYCVGLWLVCLLIERPR